MLREFIISNDYKNIKSITSTRRFWLTNAEKYRKLTKLAEILLHINSSSTCICRMFLISIGFTDISSLVSLFEVSIDESSTAEKGDGT